ncbi:MAG: nuclear transport factor 2 family protein [Pseudomonadota bacterium]
MSFDSEQTFQTEKRVVRDYQAALEACTPGTELDVLMAYCESAYRWYGVHPFGEQDRPDAVAEQFWGPLRTALHALQRREDIFLAGRNAADGQVWTISMGHFLGLFDAPWLCIPPTGRIATVRYAEFQCVVEGRLVAGAMFVDLLGLMAQAGVYPLAPETGVYFVYPGPRTHDGILLDPQSEAESQETLALVETMIADLTALNSSGTDRQPLAEMARTWDANMLWYGPCGIGATYTMERYREQHQIPFRAGLTDKVFNGHVCRIAEGHYAGFFGWPNLTNTATGGFLGLPGNDVRADMRVVDLYRREGDRLAENWVLIDLPYWLKQQGLDVFERMAQLAAPKGSAR